MLQLPADEVHIWLVKLDRTGPPAEVLTQVLSEQERERVQRFRWPTDARRYLAAHAALRGVVGRYLHAEPQHVRFDHSCRHCGHPSHGKPRVLGLPPDAALEISMSHSQGVAAIAATAGTAVGVDIEGRDRWGELDLHSFTFLSPAEEAVVRPLPPEQRGECLTQAWVAKEAVAKALGLGVALDFLQVSALVGSAAGRVEVATRVSAAGQEWTLASFPAGRGLVGHVATSLPLHRVIQQWEWSSFSPVHT